MEDTRESYSFYVGTINNRITFFREVITFFASCEPTLEVRGKLPQTIVEKISSHVQRSSTTRKLLFHEKYFKLSNSNVAEITSALGGTDVISKITWSIDKDGTLLAFCGNWKNNVILESGTYADSSRLKELLDKMLQDAVIEDYEEELEEPFFYINTIKNEPEFFNTILAYFASRKPILTISVNFPKEINAKLDKFREEGSIFGDIFTSRKHFKISEESYPVILDAFHEIQLMPPLKWGLAIKEVPLALHDTLGVMIYSSEYASAKEIITVLDKMILDTIIEGYEKADDDEFFWRQ